MKRDKPNTHKVKFANKSFEYPMVDYYKSLTRKEVTFDLHWEQMPVVGPILKVFFHLFRKVFH
jgi:hypothetical protein